MIITANPTGEGAETVRVIGKMRIVSSIRPDKLEDMKNLLASCIMKSAAGIADDLEKILPHHVVGEKGGNTLLYCHVSEIANLPTIWWGAYIAPWRASLHRI